MIRRETISSESPRAMATAGVRGGDGFEHDQPEGSRRQSIGLKAFHPRSLVGGGEGAGRLGGQICLSTVAF
jgi:hypothetical protein